MNNRSHLLFVFLFMMQGTIQCAVKSLETIQFDAHNDNLIDATLNSDGFTSNGFISSTTNLIIGQDAEIKGKTTIGSNIITSSNLNINGSISFLPYSTSSSVSAGDHNLYLMNTTSEDLTLTLPAAASSKGREIRVKKTATNHQVTVSAQTGETVDKVPYVILKSGDMSSGTFFCDGSQWYVIENRSIASELYSDNLIFHLKFDKKMGNAIVDSSQNGLTATRSNFETSGNGWVSGQRGNAIQLDGVNDYVEFEANSLFLPSRFSIGLWVYPTRTAVSDGRQHTFLSMQKSSTQPWAQNYSFVTYASGVANVPRFNFTDANGTAQYGAAAYSSDLQTNQWYHMMATYDGTGVYFYLNGTLKGSDTDLAASGLQYVEPSKLFIGDKRNNTEENAASKIDDVRIYNRALSADEISKLYNYR